ncbi:MAG: hypothetical protein O7G86_13230 [Gammaproteobacteria bacterium]|nr:hypothetical protein [Gammaproteobacteria bacterium]
MYRKFVAIVLGLNGLILVLIGYMILATAETQLAALDLEASQIQQVVPTYYGLGLSDALSSLFSFAAMVLVYRENPSGRTLSLIIGIYLALVGLGLYLLSGALFGLYFISARGLIIAGLAWKLSRETQVSRATPDET